MKATPLKALQLIEPAGTAHQGSLLKNVDQLTQAGFEVLYQPLKIDSSWPYTSGSRDARLAQLSKALHGESELILATRGGYGVSDLLPHIDWVSLKKAKPKIIIGFSDITALQHAAYTQLGWKSLHAPMPGSTLWGQHETDINVLLTLMQNPFPWSQKLKLTMLAGNPHSVEGTMLGGCFSVLTNLLGTPYFKLSSKESILFLEDTGEHPARLLRFWQQWQQTGYATGLKAIILGHLHGLCDVSEYQETKARLAMQMHTVSGIPIYSTESFGHCSPNVPIGIGAVTSLDHDDNLNWTLK